jgi:hypothetical protein
MSADKMCDAMLANVTRCRRRTWNCGDLILGAILNVIDGWQQTPEVAQNLRS